MKKNMVRSNSTTLKLSWTILLVYTVSTALAIKIQKAKKGDDVSLVCDQKKPLNWWDKDSKIIGRQAGRIQQNVQGDLVFKSVQYSDSGIYSCSEADGSGKHTQIRLLVYGPPSLANVTKVINVQKDKEAVINCAAAGHPEPRTTWFIYKSGQIQKIADGNTLNFLLPCKYCKVYFLCKAVNEYGEVSSNITVNVVGKPDVKVSEESVTSAIGEDVAVHCEIKSNPPCLYMQWLKNGKLVRSSNRKRIDLTMFDEHKVVVTLSIERMKEKDFDDYVCLAVNEYGNQTQTIQITLESTESYRTVKKKPRVSPLSASTELVISSGEIQKQTTKSKNQDNKAPQEEAATQSTESVSSGSVCKNSWKQLTAMVLLSCFMYTSFFS